jgi:hypothetical protein
VKKWGATLDPDVPLVGLVTEREALRTAIVNRKSSLIVGPPGAGKTRVALSVLTDRGPAVAIYLDHTPVLHQLLTDLGRKLIAGGHALTKAIGNDEPDTWLAKQTSVHLKGTLWNALAAEPATIVLDHVNYASFPTYRFLQRVYHTPRISLVAIVRHPKGLGALQRLFWDPRETIPLRPLREQEAQRLFDEAVKCFGLGCLNLDEFRHDVLKAASGNPGKIVEMCRRATGDTYRKDGRVLFSPLWLDSLARFMA